MIELLRVVIGLENGNVVVSVRQSSSSSPGPPAAANGIIGDDAEQARALLAECGVRHPERWLASHPAWQIIDVCRDCIGRGGAVRDRASYVVTVLLRGGTPGRR
jgi:hypothetical protein